MLNENLQEIIDYMMEMILMTEEKNNQLQKLKFETNHDLNKFSNEGKS